MLKLERAVPNGLISIIIRDKERFLTKPLAMAFIIAFTIHLSLLLLFHIAPITYGTHQTVFPPTRAEAESEARESVVADIKLTTPSIRGLPPPPSSRPHFPHTPQFLTIRPMEQIATGSPIPLDFHQLEIPIYQPSFQPLVKGIQEPFLLFISGSLSEQPFHINGLKGKIPPDVQNPTCIVYEVMVEGKTGKVFWFEPTQYLNTALAKFAEEVLRDMTFDLDSTLAVVSGQVELHFNPEGL